ncbi:MAG: hypothetical protein HOM34_01285 [Planctomycetes bacterium]|jgi:MFS family permease|nr:hypothetical protein [Planctomycetota bacterium]MBT4029039.1 hypothetical protein [Planctomycetota bacterium]MBT4560341.1 hypothetical protein [Planctomycetota bacterium]MBT5102111.1 hypothetical protein [Planctomycetota bacterium]MBT5119334.1 hypothetical protein [Planctomycetota bacterium]
MNDPLNLDSIEENAYRKSNLDDGIFDILIGFCLLLWAVSLHFDYGALGGIWFAVLFPTVAPIRKKLMLQRVGSAQPTPERQSKETKKRSTLIFTLAGTFLLGVAAFFLFAAKDGLVGDLAESMRGLGSSILAVPLVLISIMIAITYKLPRAFFYAFFVVASFSLVRFAETSDHWSQIHIAILLSAIAPIVTGTLLLRKYLHDHPVLLP